MGVLHRQRARLEDTAKREAAGESLWTKEFSNNVRVKLHFVIADCFRWSAGGELLAGVSTSARRVILREEGLLQLSAGSTSEAGDFWKFFYEASDDWMPTLVEAIIQALRSARLCEPGTVAYGIEEGINLILLEDRISYELIEGVMVERALRRATDLDPAPPRRADRARGHGAHGRVSRTLGCLGLATGALAGDNRH